MKTTLVSASVLATASALYLWSKSSKPNSEHEIDSNNFETQQHLSTKCQVCKMPATYFCAKCNKTAYCGLSCQIHDRKEHRLICKKLNNHNINDNNTIWQPIADSRSLFPVPPPICRENVHAIGRLRRPAFTCYSLVPHGDIWADAYSPSAVMTFLLNLDHSPDLTKCQPVTKFPEYFKKSWWTFSSLAYGPDDPRFQAYLETIDWIENLLSSGQQITYNKELLCEINYRLTRRDHEFLDYKRVPLSDRRKEQELITKHRPGFFRDTAHWIEKCNLSNATKPGVLLTLPYSWLGLSPNEERCWREEIAPKLLPLYSTFTNSFPGVLAGNTIPWKLHQRSILNKLLITSSQPNEIETNLNKLMNQIEEYMNKGIPIPELLPRKITTPLNFRAYKKLAFLRGGTTDDIQWQLISRHHIFAVARFIEGLALIAPFSNGNVRTSMLFANILLSQGGYPPMVIYDRAALRHHLFWSIHRSQQDINYSNSPWILAMYIGICIMGCHLWEGWNQTYYSSFARSAHALGFGPAVSGTPPPNDLPPPKPLNSSVFFSLVEQRLSTEDDIDFHARSKPTSVYLKAWRVYLPPFHNTSQSDRDTKDTTNNNPNPSVYVDLPNQITRARDIVSKYEKSQLTASILKQIGVESGLTMGKWVAQFNSSEIDSYWLDTVCSLCWQRFSRIIFAKSSTRKTYNTPPYYYKTYIICWYTKNFCDEKDIMDAGREIRKVLKIDRMMRYKAELYSHIKFDDNIAPEFLYELPKDYPR